MSPEAGGAWKRLAGSDGSGSGSGRGVVAVSWDHPQAAAAVRGLGVGERWAESQDCPHPPAAMSVARREAVTMHKSWQWLPW